MSQTMRSSVGEVVLVTTSRLAAGVAVRWADAAVLGGHDKTASEGAR
jgi:hypothetical protein